MTALLWGESIAPSLAYSIPDSSSTCSISSSLTTTLRRGMRKIMVDAQARDKTKMPALSATGVAKWPPRQAPNCEASPLRDANGL
jgi:hypothetical protein